MGPKVFRTIDQLKIQPLTNAMPKELHELKGQQKTVNFQSGVKELAEKWKLGGTVGDQVNFS